MSINSSSKKSRFFIAFDRYAAAKTPFVAESQVKDYNTLRKHLYGFSDYSSQHIAFNNLNLRFYNEFVDYLTNKVIQMDGQTIGLKTNTVGKLIRMFKAFINYEMASKHITHVDLSAFRAPSEETHAIYLTERELGRIYALDLQKDQELEQIRDLFIVGCFTGLRYSDLSTLERKHIDFKYKNIVITQRKVHSSVTIPMIDYVPDIMRKYNYNLPKISKNRFNVKVKELGRLAKINQPVEVVNKKGNTRIVEQFAKWQLISSHTCRRSFCTNMFLCGMPSETLRLISGHKSPEAFKRYIRIDNHQAANELRNLRNRRNKTVAKMLL